MLLRPVGKTNDQQARARLSTSKCSTPCRRIANTANRRRTRVAPVASTINRRILNETPCPPCRRVDWRMCACTGCTCNERVFRGTRHGSRGRVSTVRFGCTYTTSVWLEGTLLTQVQRRCTLLWHLIQSPTLSSTVGISWYQSHEVMSNTTKPYLVMLCGVLSCLTMRKQVKLGKAKQNSTKSCLVMGRNA